MLNSEGFLSECVLSIVFLGCACGILFCLQDRARYVKGMRYSCWVNENMRHGCPGDFQHRARFRCRRATDSCEDDDIEVSRRGTTGLILV